MRYLRVSTCIYYVGRAAPGRALLTTYGALGCAIVFRIVFLSCGSRRTPLSDIHIEATRSNVSIRFGYASDSSDTESRLSNTSSGQSVNHHSRWCDSKLTWEQTERERERVQQPQNKQTMLQHSAWHVVSWGWQIYSLMHNR